MDNDKEPILNSGDFTIDFQEFSSTVAHETPTFPATESSTEYQFSTEQQLNQSNNLLLQETEVPLQESEDDSRPTSAVWSFEFYKQFFDIDDRKVLHRLLFSFVPTPSSSYLEKLKPLPDFYGPFWVCITLIFSIAISGNLADFFETLGDDKDWEYDFKKVTISATIIFSYVTVIPALLSGLLWWRKSNSALKLVEALSLYGYSLTIFIPISILLCVNYEWLRWLLVLATMATSGSVLALTLWSALSEEPRQITLIVTAVLVAIHVGFILLFKLYFFTTTTKSTSPSS